MKEITAPVIENLRRAQALLEKLSPAQFTDKQVGPYHSSVGEHLRHILDIFACIFRGMPAGMVDLAARERNELVETVPEKASEYLDTILTSLEGLDSASAGTLVNVTDDLGMGPVQVPYTLGGAICQAHSHAIHHFACIGYILDRLGVEVPDARFGYNPTTPDVERR